MSVALNCPVCDGPSSVADSRPAKGVDGIKRRRACLICGERFSTLELRSGESPRALIDAEMKALRDDIAERVARTERVIWGADI